MNCPSFFLNKIIRHPPPTKRVLSFLTFVANGYKEVKNAASPIADIIRMTNDNAKKVVIVSTHCRNPKAIFAAPQMNTPLTKSRCALSLFKYFPKSGMNKIWTKFTEPNT